MLLRRLGYDEPHVGPRDRFANRLGGDELRRHLEVACRVRGQQQSVGDLSAAQAPNGVADASSEGHRGRVFPESKPTATMSSPCALQPTRQSRLPRRGNGHASSRPLLIGSATTPRLTMRRVITRRRKSRSIGRRSRLPDYVSYLVSRIALRQRELGICRGLRRSGAVIQRYVWISGQS